jgi:pilus assembly protein CpaC
MREIGADILAVDPDTGNIFGTQIGGAAVEAMGEAGLGGLLGIANGTTGPATTAFGIFPSGDFQILLRALRSNSVLNILAEPNLMAMSGHRASFLAGGQFPVPVPQSTGGVTNSVTVEFKDFGVRLDFIPYVQDDETIRLHVAPEVSSIDFAIGTTLVVGGDPVPGVNTRRSETTVELRQGQTLAIAGLLEVDLDAKTDRIPGVGDLPYLGPLFSNTSHKRVEKELIVLVTPFLVAPMNPGHVAPLPGEEIRDPNDKEFYFLNRIEGRTGREFRPTTTWDNPLGCVEKMKLEKRCTCGPVGFSE